MRDIFSELCVMGHDFGAICVDQGAICVMMLRFEAVLGLGAKGFHAI